MKNRVIIAAVAVFFAVHLLFFWMNATVDTFFFAAFAKFIRTGTYVWPIESLPYKSVQTGAPPLYSVLLAALSILPRADIFLHIVQLAMFVITAWLVYIMLKERVSSKAAWLGVLAYVLIPGNLIFVSYVMSDMGAQFLFTLYIFLIHLFLSRRKTMYLSQSVLVGFLTGLQRYSFVVFGVLSFCVLALRHPKSPRIYLTALLGCALFATWILVQHALTGVWGLTNDTGIRYNIQMMWQAQVLPPETDPSMIEIRKYLAADVDLRQAYWDLEPLMVPAIGYDYVRMTKLIGDVGKAALWYHPFAFIRVTARSFFLSHQGIPYYPNLGTFGQPQDPALPLQCDLEGSIELCEPIIRTPYSEAIWNTFIAASKVFYLRVFPFLSYAVFFPILTLTLLWGNTWLRVMGSLFVLGRLPIAMATSPEPRYIVPFYPLMVLIVVAGVFRGWRYLFRKKKASRHP